jgi:hypothetical protein
LKMGAPGGQRRKCEQQDDECGKDPTTGKHQDWEYYARLSLSNEANCRAPSGTDAARSRRAFRKGGFCESVRPS